MGNDENATAEVIDTSAVLVRISAMSSWSLSKVYNDQPGWYCGELHAHSLYSDGYHSPEKLAELAAAAGLDFLAITDHNRFDAYTSNYPNPDFLVIPGIEITLQNGHFNIYGFDGWQDWMENICIGLFTVKLAGKYSTPTQLMRRTANQGLINSINHPLREPFDWCDNDTELAYVHCLEIWNKPDWPDPVQSNMRAIALWTKWLNAGYQTTAVGGSDHHTIELRPGEKRLTERVGWPKNYVHAAELSAEAVLSGIRRHRVYVSMGPEVAFQATVGDRAYGIGDEVGEADGAIELTASVSNCPTLATAQIVKNGEILITVSVEDDRIELAYGEDIQSAQPAWYRLDVYDEQGQMLAITNPIFTGPAVEPTLRTFGDFASV